MFVLQLIVLSLFGIFCILGIIVTLKFILKKPIWTPSTNGNIKQYIKEEKELYAKIHEEIKEAGWINNLLLKKKLGPLYHWYEGGFLIDKNSKRKE